MRTRLSIVILVLMIAGLGVQAGETEDAEPAWKISTCAKGQIAGKRVRISGMRYVVPKGAILKKFRDVDHGGYHVLLNHNGKREVLTLVWQVNGSPVSSQARTSDSVEHFHRVMIFPNGGEGIDSRGTDVIEGNERRWRSAGVSTELAFYRDVSPKSAKYFDAIIESVCYQPQ